MLPLGGPTTTDGTADADVSVARRDTYLARDHIASILLTDAATGAVIGVDYKADTTERRDRRGNLVGVHLQIPSGTSVPSRVRAYVITDVFPLAARIL